MAERSSGHPRTMLPVRGNRLTRMLGRLVLALGGWRIAGKPPQVAKLVCIVAPHTSNWDFIIGIAAVFALGLDVRWLGKHTLFRGPSGPLMHWLGGIPVDRSAPHGYSVELSRLFGQSERLLLGIAPEGTRSRVERWRSGFYAIATAAGVPIVLCYLDYVDKIAGFGPAISPCGDPQRDMTQIADFYRGVRAKRPERFNPDVRL